MFIPKKYGSYKVEKCPFCEKQSTLKSKQGVPVCLAHKNEIIEDFRCQCNGYLDLMDGKFGPYFKCMKCGNVSFSRALEMNKEKLLRREPTQTVQKSQPHEKTSPSSRPKTNGREEITITSDQVDVYFS